MSESKPPGETGEEVGSAGLANLMAGFVAVKSAAQGAGFRRGRGGRGECPCPVCKGTISYAVAATNGHIWARCGTPGCLRFLE